MVADGAAILRLTGSTARVALLGGVWRAGAPIVRPFERELQVRCPGMVIEPPCFPPVIGALLIAYRQAGVTLTSELLRRLDHGVHYWGLG